MVTSAHLAGVLLVVIEILRREEPVLVPHEAVALHAGGVPLELELHVLGHGDQRRARFMHQHLARFGERIDVRILTVALVGELLHRGVFQIALAEAEHRQKYA